MNNFVKAAAWLIAAATAFATLGPPSARPHLPIGQNGEHALAFMVVGIVVGIAYTRHRLRTALIGVALTGLLELAQLVMPGRHARWMDFAVDATALCIGLGLAAIAQKPLQRLGLVSPNAGRDGAAAPLRSDGPSRAA